MASIDPKELKELASATNALSSKMSDIEKTMGSVASNLKDIVSLFVKSQSVVDATVKGQSSLNDELKKAQEIKKGGAGSSTMTQEERDLDATLRNIEANRQLNVERKAAAEQQRLQFLHAEEEVQRNQGGFRNEINSYQNLMGHGAKNELEKRLVENPDGMKDKLRAYATVDEGLGAKDFAANTVQKMTQGVPFGGLMGMVLLGRENEFNAAAASQRIVQVLEGAAGGGMSEASKTATEISFKYFKNLQDGVVKDMESISRSFASVGQNAFKNLGNGSVFQTATEGENNLAMATEKLDMKLEQAGGTTAKWAKELNENFGRSIYGATTDIFKMAEGISGTVVQKSEFINKIMQSSAALRMYKMDVMDVANAQIAFGKSMGDTPWARQYAARGVENAASSVAGMDTGLSAVIGERLGSKLQGGKANGLDAWYAMKGGAPEVGGDHDTTFKDSILELKKLASEGGRTRSEQIYFLMQVAHMSKEGAELTYKADTLKNTDWSGSTGDKFKKEYEGSMQSEAQKISELARIVKNMATTWGQIGVEILGTLMSLVKLVAGIAQVIEGYFEGGASGAATTAAGRKNVDSAVLGEQGHIKRLKGLSGEMGGDFKKYMKDVFGDSDFETGAGQHVSASSPSTPGAYRSPTTTGNASAGASGGASKAQSLASLGKVLQAGGQWLINAHSDEEYEKTQNRIISHLK